MFVVRRDDLALRHLAVMSHGCNVSVCYQVQHCVFICLCIAAPVFASGRFYVFVFTVLLQVTRDRLESHLHPSEVWTRQAGYKE